jgi:hypothetical protein
MGLLLACFPLSCLGAGCLLVVPSYSCCALCVLIPDQFTCLLTCLPLVPVCLWFACAAGYGLFTVLLCWAGSSALSAAGCLSEL